MTDYGGLSIGSQIVDERLATMMLTRDSVADEVEVEVVL